MGSMSNLRSSYWPADSSPMKHFTMHPMCNLMLRSSIDTVAKTYEAPLICLRKVRDIVSNCDGKNIPKGVRWYDCVLPVNKSIYSLIEKKTFDAIFRFITNSYYNGLQEVKLNDTTYYVGVGLICDSNFNPLVMFTRQETYYEGTFANVSSKYNVLRISPEVMSADTNPLKTGIIKKLIPYFSSEVISFLIDPLPRISYPNKVIIESLKDFYYLPTKPEVNVDTLNNEINALLVKNAVSLQECL